MSDENDRTNEDTTAAPGNGGQESAVPAPGPGADGAPPANGADDIKPAEFGDLNDTSNEPGPLGWDMQMLRDIPVTLTVEVGRSAISINNLLQLSQGSVVELDRTAGEALDVMVNGCLVAHGEVVVVNDKFGIRLTDVVSPSDRVKKLN